MYAHTLDFMWEWACCVLTHVPQFVPTHCSSVWWFNIFISVSVRVCVCVWEKGGGCLPWWKLLLTRSFNDRSEVATDRHRDRPPLNPQPSVPPHLHTRLPTHSRIIADWFHIVIIREETSGAGWVHTLLMEQTNFCLDYSLYAECYTERIIGDFLHKEHKY